MLRIVWLLILCMVLWAVAGAVGAANPPKPDLRCTALSVEKVETKEVPLRVRVHLEVHNKGVGSNPHYAARLVYRKGSSGPWTTVKEFPLPPGPSGGGAIWNPVVDLQEGGTYTFKVEVDFANQVSESNEGNNSKSITKTFQGGTPDLVVENVVAGITRTAANGAISTRVTWDVRNIGDGKADGLFVTVLKVSKDGGPFVELARKSKSNLNAGAKVQFTQNHNFTSVKKLKFRIETDATRTIHEHSESNNDADSQVVQH